MTLPKANSSRKPPLTPDQKQNLRQLYLQGDPVLEIAAKFGVTHGSVRYHCQDLPARTSPAERTPEAHLSLLDMPKPPDWMEEAACARHPDPEIFFPYQPAGQFGLQIKADMLEAAKATCYRCPVWKKCLQYALDLPPADCQGVWAATTEPERVKLRKLRDAA